MLRPLMVLTFIFVGAKLFAGWDASWWVVLSPAMVDLVIHLLIGFFGDTK